VNPPEEQQPIPALPYASGGQFRGRNIVLALGVCWLALGAIAFIGDLYSLSAFPPNPPASIRPQLVMRPIFGLISHGLMAATGVAVALRRAAARHLFVAHVATGIAQSASYLGLAMWQFRTLPPSSVPASFTASIGYQIVIYMGGMLYSVAIILLLLAPPVKQYLDELLTGKRTAET
jgi:hypothetical protein